MIELDALRLWIESHETLLSGAAAAVFMATLAASPMAGMVRVLRGDRTGPPDTSPGPDSMSAEQLLERPAVAVLPFENRSPGEDQDYLAAGITESLITALSAMRSFPVIGRASVFGLTNDEGAGAADIAGVARMLRARYVVLGSVSRVDQALRVSVQLVDGESGHLIWGRRYDRTLQCFFALQDEITAEIASALEPTLGRAEERRALAMEDERLDAWECTLRALWHVRRGGHESYAEAQKLLDYAIVRDPLSSQAHSVMALCHFQRALQAGSDDPGRALAGTLRAAREAVELDESDWLAHALLGIASLWTLRDYDAAIGCEQRALELNPSASVSHQFMGCVLEFAGRPQDAIRSLEIVLALEPRYQSRAMVLADLSLCHLMLGDEDAAVDYARRALAEQPDNVRAHQRLVSALGQKGPNDAAREAFARLTALQPDLCEAMIRATYPFRHEEDAARFIGGLHAAGLARA